MSAELVFKVCKITGKEYRGTKDDDGISPEGVKLLTRLKPAQKWTGTTYRQQGGKWNGDKITVNDPVILGGDVAFPVISERSIRWYVSVDWLEATFKEPGNHVQDSPAMPKAIDWMGTEVIITNALSEVRHGLHATVVAKIRLKDNNIGWRFRAADGFQFNVPDEVLRRQYGSPGNYASEAHYEAGDVPETVEEENPELDFAPKKTYYYPVISDNGMVYNDPFKSVTDLQEQYGSLHEYVRGSDFVSSDYSVVLDPLPNIEAESDDK